MPLTLYVYFKLDETEPALIGSLADLTVAMQEDLAGSATCTRQALLRRRDDALTWMEVYEGIVDAEQFRSVLAEARSRYGLDRFGLIRHEEWFQPL